jgi:aldose 1-epimerase
MIAKSNFGKIDGKDVFLYTFSNDKMSFSVMQRGATLVSAFVPDRNGEKKDVLLGFDNVSDWAAKSDNQGVIAGPYANRIGGGKFSIDGVEFNLVKNEKGIQTLHGNFEFGDAIWDAEIIDPFTVKFSYFSPDGLNGFPGNVKCDVIYSLVDTAIRMEFYAETDKKTPINPTNHAYFNLRGFDGGDILSHKMKINADKFTVVDINSIPTGENRDVVGTPFDFREFKAIGDEINADCEQLKNTNGYDHNFCVNGEGFRTAAVVFEEVSARMLKVNTDLPGIQFYAGNFLKGVLGKDNKPMNFRTGFCLETQFYPDSPNNPSFPDCFFTPEKPYKSVTEFEFSTL